MDNFSLIQILLGLISLLALFLEGGYRIGRWRHVRTPGEKDQVVGAMVGSILGLLAFMLAFTFSLAASRFEARRGVVLEEANAVGTTYLRARLLGEPEKSEITKILAEYVDVRLKGVLTKDLTGLISESEKLHEALWQQTIALSKKGSDSIITGLFINSLNELIDLHAKRLLVGVRSRIPLVIWVGLFSLAALGMAAMGYQAGLSATKRSPAMIILILAFAGVMFLIADLDRGQEGFLKVSQEALIDVQNAIKNTPP